VTKGETGGKISRNSTEKKFVPEQQARKGTERGNHDSWRKGNETKKGEKRGRSIG